MDLADILQIVIFVAALVVATPLLGNYMARVYSGERHPLSLLFGKVESGLYRLSGVDREKEMEWKGYLKALLIFNALGFLAVFSLQLLQRFLPLNPQGLPGVSVPLAFNAAVSFMTNTNWQAYAGETTLSYLTQMLGLTVQNFLSAATGIAVFLALTRGIARRSMTGLGNFWVDVTRSVLYILLPLSILLSVALAGQGVVQNFSAYRVASTIEGAEQVLPMGPAASQIAIKQLGTNGGGFFNANSAHPYENPTPLTNWLEMFSILLIPAALTATYGAMVRARRQGRILFAVMMLIYLAGLAIALYAEYAFNPVMGLGGAMEGKETRLGVVNSVLWAVSTTAASNGSVNAMHASLSPLAGGVALLNILLGELVFGGVGTGMYTMLLFAMLTVFLSGLMVGRTPEYLGKKIEIQEIKLVILAILIPNVVILMGAGISCVLPAGLASLLNHGPHGLTEILYAVASATGNNGSSFAGLNADTIYYDLMLGFAMLVGRFAVIIPVLGIAGGLASKKWFPPSEGTFGTDNALFGGLLIAVIVIVGALTFFPVLSLGPLMEHLLMLQGIPS